MGGASGTVWAWQVLVIVLSLVEGGDRSDLCGIAAGRKTRQLEVTGCQRLQQPYLWPSITAASKHL